MELNPEQWHVKFYFWCLDVWDAFVETHTDRDRSNICQYIRTIFPLMPLSIIVNVAFWLYVFYVLIYYPLTSFGVIGSGAGYLAVAFILGGFWLFFNKRKELKERRREEQVAEMLSGDDYFDDDIAENQSKGPGFIEVVWQYLVSMKNKVCVPIYFRSNHPRESI